MVVILSFFSFHSLTLILFGLFILFSSDPLWETTSLRFSQSDSFLIPFPAKQDIQLRLHTLSPPRSLPSYPLHLQNPLPLPQLSTLLTLLNQSLDIIDISTWTGDPHNGSFIAGQLRLLADTIDEARQVLKGGEEVNGGRWWEEPADETVRFEFRPLCKDIPLFPYEYYLFISPITKPKTQQRPPFSNSRPPSPPFSPCISPLSMPPSFFTYAPSPP